MDRRWHTGPHLDSAAEPWRATFPGLGTVLVDDTGRLTVQPEQASRDVEEALRWGWGENLFLARQGYQLLTGSAVVAPDRASALLLTGDAHDVAIVLLALVSQGWAALADRVTPFRWQADRLLAHPRQAPVLVSRRRARKAGWEARGIRQGSDTVAVEVPRWCDPALLRGVVLLRTAKASEAIEALPLSGAHLLAVAAGLRAPGVLAVPAEGPETEPAPDASAEEWQEARRARAAAAMRADLRLAQAAPILRLGFDSDRQDEVLDALLQWFDQEGQ